MLRQQPELAANAHQRWINSKAGFQQAYREWQVILTQMPLSDCNLVPHIIPRQLEDTQTTLLQAQGEVAGESKGTETLFGHSKTVQ